MISIPSGLFNRYFEAADLFIDHEQIGKDVTLFYETKVDNNSFLNDSDTQLTSENIRLRVYYSPKDWNKVQVVEFINGRIQVIGYMSDMTKLTRATYIVINSIKYKLATFPLGHGFGNRYFVAFLDLI